MNNKKLWLLILLVVAILGAAAFYFLYFVRTPAYALNAVRDAYQKHDVAKFEQYVDTKSVAENAFDDIIKGESKINHDGIFSNPFALGILRMLKPAVTDLMEDEIRNFVAKKPEQNENETAQQNVDPVPDAMRRNMERHVPLKKMVFKNLSISSHKNNLATASLILHSNEYDKDYVVELDMEQNKNGGWQIKRMGNLADLIVEIDAAKKAKEAANNQEVLDRLNASVNVTKISLNMFKDNNPAAVNTPPMVLNAVVTAENKSGNSIVRMYYDVNIFDGDKMVYSYPAHFEGEFKAGSTLDLNSSKKLNELLPDDKKLMGQDITKYTCKIQVNFIAFADGNVISPNMFIEY